MLISCNALQIESRILILFVGACVFVRVCVYVCVCMCAQFHIYMYSCMIVTTYAYRNCVLGSILMENGAARMSRSQ